MFIQSFTTFEVSLYQDVYNTFVTPKQWDILFDIHFNFNVLMQLESVF